MSLSACLVTRNEEQNLQRVIGSARGVADEVIVVDTHSADRSAAVAAEQGAKVFQHEWHDDFAAARNDALDRASGDWVLWLNPDEELLPISRPTVEALLARADALAYVVRVQELVKADQPDRFVETAQLRLFRRIPDIRYVGRLHPNFAVPVAELAKRLQKNVYPAELTLRHHAYLSQLSEGKLRWAARLLEQELHDRPGQLHYLIEYGRTLLWLNDPKGHEVLADALERLRTDWTAAVPPTPTVGVLLEYLLTVSPEQSRCRITREEALDLAMRWFPSSPPLLWRAAEFHFQKSDFRRAAGLLEQLVHYGATGTYDRSTGFDPTIVNEGAVLNLGVCVSRLGQFSRAEQLFRLLLQSPSHRDQATKALAELERMKQQAAGGGPTSP
jgi:tetratricopeptide (TPR) repeat protein